MLEVRLATARDFDRIMEIYHYAQDYMIQMGNPDQWGHIYPDPVMVREDIAKKTCHIIYDENDQVIHGVFALFEGEDPTYQYIEDGRWLNEDPYVTIHRIAGGGTGHGIFRCASDYCKSRFRNIRIDTHHNNLTMQDQIEKNDFKRCGIIYVEDGSPRIAYHWVQEACEMRVRES